MTKQTTAKCSICDYRNRLSECILCEDVFCPMHHPPANHGCPDEHIGQCWECGAGPTILMSDQPDNPKVWCQFCIEEGRTEHTLEKYDFPNSLFQSTS